jgi:hypothetical protein
VETTPERKARGRSEADSGFHRDRRERYNSPRPMSNSPATPSDPRAATRLPGPDCLGKKKSSGTSPELTGGLSVVIGNGASRSF